MNLFADTNINTGRQVELDWARGLAVFFMILVHVKLELPGIPLSSMYSKIIEFAGSPLAAPTFMLLLGVGITYSRNTDVKKLVKHGLYLLVLHYALNFASFGLPYLVLMIQMGNLEYFHEFIFYTIGIDILAFAGLTFLFFALKEKLRFDTIHLILCTLILALLNYVLNLVMNEIWTGPSLGMLVRANDNSYFPFLSWIGYPVMGYVFGTYLKRCTDKKVFYQYLFAFSILIVALVTMGSLKYKFDIWSMHFGPEDYYYQDFIQYILVGGICFAWISILYALSQTKIHKLLGNLLGRWSRNVTAIYCAQWIIIGWFSILTLIDFPADPLVNFAVGIGVVILSDVAAIVVKRKKRIKLTIEN